MLQQNFRTKERPVDPRQITAPQCFDPCSWRPFVHIDLRHAYLYVGRAENANRSAASKISRRHVSIEKRHTCTLQCYSVCFLNNQGKDVASITYRAIYKKAKSYFYPSRGHRTSRLVLFTALNPRKICPICETNIRKTLLIRSSNEKKLQYQYICVTAVYGLRRLTGQTIVA